MEFNLSTFILETINFLILIWILQRLFYKPLLEVIAKRKQSIDQALADSKAIHEQAEEQRRLYENRQKLWEQEKQSALTALHLQIETERRTQMIQLEFDLEQERKKNKMTLCSVLWRSCGLWPQVDSAAHPGCPSFFCGTAATVRYPSIGPT